MTPTTLKRTPILIVDDEPSGRNSLARMIEDYCPELTQVGEAASVREAVSQIRLHQPRLVFLDVELRPGSGFDILDQFDPVPFKVVFCTAFDHYALRAFRYAAVDYLCKPIDIQELKQAVRRATQVESSFDQQLQLLRENIRRREINKIALPRRDGFAFAEVNRIMYLKADGSYTHFHFQSDPSILVSKRIGHYEGVLDPIAFLRIHQSYLINLRHLQAFHNTKNGRVTMANGEELPIARNRKAVLYERLQQLGMM